AREGRLDQARPQARDPGRGDGWRHPGPHPLLPRRRDGADARPGEGVRLPHRRLPPRRGGLQDRRPARRRGRVRRAVGRLVGLQDGSLRRDPGERRDRRPRAGRLRDRAFGLGRGHPAAQPGGGQGDRQRAPRRDRDRARARDHLAHPQRRPRPGRGPRHRHPGARQDGRCGAVERQSVQRLRPGREGLDRRRAGVRPPRCLTPAGDRLHARPADRAGRCAMNRRPVLRRAALLLAALLPLSAAAQDVLIRNATVHTATARGTLQDTDVLVQGGRIAAIGTGLPAGSAQVVDAAGAPLTPALFGGITAIGIEEVSGEASTRDGALALGQNARDITVRPEFDVTLAYNPESILLPVARVEGIGFTLLNAGTTAGGSIIGGQGAVVRLDGSPDPIGPKALFVSLGARASSLSGSSRAGQWMLLDQLVDEARGRIPADSRFALLTPAGRATLARYLDGGGRVVVAVDRAADIRQLLRWAHKRTLKIGIAGGAEAWKLAPELARAGVPVFVDTLANLPGNFDRLGATLENAARLHAAGVEVGFSQSDDASHN